MDIIKEFKDDQYPRKGDWKERRIARGVVINGDGLFALHRIKRNDIFGNYAYYETPGGGIDLKESPATAFQRECEEELGYQVEILGEIGIIKDEYALLSRKNVNYYFLAKATKYVGKHLVSDGDSLIERTLYLPLGEILSLYENLPNKGIPFLLKRRELPIWLKAEALLNREKDALSLAKPPKLY